MQSRYLSQTHPDFQQGFKHPLQGLAPCFVIACILVVACGCIVIYGPQFLIALLNGG